MADVWAGPTIDDTPQTQALLAKLQKTRESNPNLDPKIYELIERIILNNPEGKENGINLIQSLLDLATLPDRLPRDTAQTLEQ